jgi:hypothetical protein
MYQALEPSARARACRITNLRRDASVGEILVGTVDSAAALANAGVFTLHADLVDALGCYRDVIIYMGEFLDEIRRPTKTDRYDDDDTLAALLETAGRHRSATNKK